MKFLGYVFGGKTSFKGAEFSYVAVFDHAEFRAEVNFSHSKFHKYARMSYVNFEKDAFFRYVEFRNKSFFEGAKFKGNALFQHTCFDWHSSFRKAKFLEQASFSMSEFKSGAEFSFTTFKNGSFFSTFIAKGIMGFENVCFESVFRFEPRDIGSFVFPNFQGAIFEKQFSISGNYNCIPDFRQTKTNHHVDLSKLNVHLRRSITEYGALREKAVDSDDAERLCRLKEIAESNKNHKRALAFHADEQRASRWGALNPWQSMLDMLYSATSNYGQSIARPVFYLALSIIMFATYSLKQPENIHKEEGQFKTAITVSIATVTPFISISKTEREAGLAKLYGDSPPEDYGLYSYAHAGISFVFIFLIGLGLRNRFRV
ncbi:pentapeptide repeat-containing protein [Pseudoalteromonas luteoviolacea]|uniref:Pentapeptide repeat-containing protein n=1 Tax=Pseudoalteromonas luteoviolacea H33 TaxID=1365251 RepID=A0A162AH79_9GAMM|nr:pentapeptide repeat-containing protein [Pseudoalteromonas luteoviolacea]KZN49884.1 hypothetical protein N476_17925 [Pseudoalteromonas luteoviolacea H33]KZN74798.1 hypothetical protein N477_21340 [Pseudoalteromonas luteoviolacea H33-S]